MEYNFIESFALKTLPPKSYNQKSLSYVSNAGAREGDLTIKYSDVPYLTKYSVSLQCCQLFWSNCQKCV